MLSRLNAIVNFVVTTRHAMGSSHESSVKVTQEQRDYALHLIRNTTLDIVETTEVIRFIQSDAFASAFGSDTARDFNAAILNNTTSTSDGMHKGRPTSQVHYFMANYVHAKEWHALKSTDHIGMLYLLVHRAHAIGLVFPSELSVANLVSIIKVIDAANSRSEMTADDTHKLILEYKRINKLKRKGVPRTLDHFPESVADFMTSYPAVYTADDPPVQCPFNTVDVDRARSTTAARKSHRSLQGASGSTQELINKNSPLGHLQQLTSALMQHVMSNSTRRDSDIELQFTNPRSSPRQSMLALQDGSVHGPSMHRGRSSEDVGSGTDGTPAKAPVNAAPTTETPSEVASAIAAVQAAMAAKSAGAESKAKAAAKVKAAAKAKSKAAAKATAKAAVAKPPAKPPLMDRTSGADAGSAKKRPASAAPIAKRPAAATGAAKKPAGKPDKPSLSVVKCRWTVLARTGIPGPGMCKVFRYEGDTTDAWAAASEWLRARCEELDIECEW